MSVRQYDEEPFPYQVEHYDGLERGQWVEVRQNDVKLPVGSKGVVLKQVAETGNYQVAVEVEGEAQKRIVALCQDQVRPIDLPLPEEPEAAAAPAEPEPEPRPDNGWSEEKRKAQSDRLRAYWDRKRAEKAAAAAEPEPAKPKRKLTSKPAPELDPALMTRHRPEGMDGAIAAAVHGEPEPEVVAAIRHVQGYRERPGQAVDLDLLQAIRQLRPEPAPVPVPQLAPVTWTRRAADAIRPVLAEAAAAGGEVTQLALLVETISYLEDGGRP